jgi:hypothetical protein
MAKRNTGISGTNKRRIMHELKINEISGVDVPAQEGATALIMKRHNVKDNPQTDDMTKMSALTTDNQGHAHLFALHGPPDGVELNSGETSYSGNHDHPWIRGENGIIVIGAAKADDGVSHTHEVAAMSKADSLVGNENEKEINNMSEDKATVEQLQIQLTRANTVAELNDAEKAHFKTLAEEAQNEFLAKSVEVRSGIIADIAKQAEETDPVVHTTVDGIDLRKSAGEALIAMAKSNDNLRKDNESLRKSQEDAVFTKRADEELKHLPGTVDERAAMLKAVEAITDESQRKAALNALHAGSAAIAKSFETIGHGGSPEPGSPTDDLDKLAKAHMQANPDLTSEQAYEAVLKTEEGGQLYAKSLN